MRFNWIDNPTISGSVMDPDVLNECLMHLKYANSPVSNNYIFDIKVTDRILDEDESLGWALQGSYIDSSYTEAINKIKKELDSSEIVSNYIGTDYEFEYKIATNGHLIADIAFKDAIDKFFNEKGIADFYIYDSTNDGLYLPRNSKFIQLTTDTNLINTYIGAGLPNIIGQIKSGASGSQYLSGAFSYLNSSSSGVSGRHDGGSDANYTSGTAQFNASLSNPIYGASDSVQPPSSLKLLYYFVGVN